MAKEIRLSPGKFKVLDALAPGGQLLHHHPFYEQKEYYSLEDVDGNTRSCNKQSLVALMADGMIKVGGSKCIAPDIDFIIVTSSGMEAYKKEKDLKRAQFAPKVPEPEIMPKVKLVRDVKEKKAPAAVVKASPAPYFEQDLFSQLDLYDDQPGEAPEPEAPERKKRKNGMDRVPRPKVAKRKHIAFDDYDALQKMVTDGNLYAMHAGIFTLENNNTYYRQSTVKEYVTRPQLSKKKGHA